MALYKAIVVKRYLFLNKKKTYFLKNRRRLLSKGPKMSDSYI